MADDLGIALLDLLRTAGPDQCVQLRLRGLLLNHQISPNSLRLGKTVVSRFVFVIGIIYES